MALFGNIPFLSAFGRSVVDILTLHPAHFVRDTLEAYKGPGQITALALRPILSRLTPQSTANVNLVYPGSSYVPAAPTPGGGGGLSSSFGGSYLDPNSELGTLYTDQAVYDNTFSGGAPWLLTSVQAPTFPR